MASSRAAARAIYFRKPTVMRSTPRNARLVSELQGLDELIFANAPLLTAETLGALVVTYQAAGNAGGHHAVRH